eukprot:Hpha_TRINITY_DN16596_c4_g8::TRINITY_DN16596_c4_g8_i1::g.136153::m.136153
MPRGMSEGMTFRMGRTVHVPDNVRAMENKVGGVCCKIIAYLFLLLLPVAVYYTELELENHRRAFRGVDGKEISMSPTANEKYFRKELGGLVHVPGSELEGNVVDGEFGLNLPGLRLGRHTEYCQWMEHSHTRCERCPDGQDSEGKTKYKDCNCVRQYSYTKGWRSHRINSLLFDQPGAHFNPQRDPFPSRTFTSGDAKMVPSNLHLPSQILDGSRLLATSRPIGFAPHGIRPPPSFGEKFANYFFGWQDTTLYGDTSELNDLPRSPAGMENFRYVGRGYFFSPYEASAMGTFAKIFVEFMEGSLLDWQVGDLLPSCTAGDIRTSYRVTAPNEISAAGELVQGRDGSLALIPHKTPHSDWAIGMVHEGSHGFVAMREADLWEQKKQAWLLRFFAIAWGLVLGLMVDLHGTSEMNFFGSCGASALMWAGVTFLAGGADKGAAIASVVALGLLVAGTRQKGRQGLGGAQAYPKKTE